MLSKIQIQEMMAKAMKILIFVIKDDLVDIIIEHEDNMFRK